MITTDRGRPWPGGYHETRAGTIQGPCLGRHGPCIPCDLGPGMHEGSGLKRVRGEVLGKGQRRGEECSVMGVRGEGPAEGVGRRQGRGGRAGVREGGPRKVCLRAPTAQHTTRPGSPQGCTNGLPARTGRARQGRRRGCTSPGGRGLVELLAPVGRRRGCRRGRWRRPRRRRCRREPAPGGGAPPSGRQPQYSALRLRSDLPRRAGLPTLRPHRPDRSEPSQHAPPLPVARTTRLGPSARRRAEAPGELSASAGRAGADRAVCGARGALRELGAVQGS